MGRLSPVWGIFLSVIVVLGTACNKFVPPTASGDFPFQERIQKETQGRISVSVGVPSREETKEIFEVDLYGKGIQPVWFKIKNGSDGPITLLPTSVDPEYFSPNEVAYKTRDFYSKEDQLKREKFFEDLDLHLFTPPHDSQTGYLFTRVDEGSKFLTADILTKNDLKRFTFMVMVPGLKIDYQEVDFDNLYRPEVLKDLNLEQLRAELEKFPCCTFSEKGELIGDPVNLVVIGKGEDALSAFIRSGWRETEIQKGQTLKTLKAYLNHARYDYAPMSTLWLFGRGQDAGFQKPRETPHERNHFRLWLTPWRYKGQEVWIGAISRDIGLRYTIKSPYFFITHKIDSDVDETREYLLEDLLAVQAVQKVGWVKGVGEVPISNPKLNPMDDPWYSDGLRMVIFLAEEPVEIDEVEVLPWEYPPEREAGPIRPLEKKK